MSRPITIGRRIGFDYGEKRIGVATSESTGVEVCIYLATTTDRKSVV